MYMYSYYRTHAHFMVIEHHQYRREEGGKVWGEVRVLENSD